ncbi:MAG UNVERIFIED_CONTAM: hypothetical protein LVR29_33055 [Microcystis novacekii LVE1205-3]
MVSVFSPLSMCQIAFDCGRQLSEKKENIQFFIGKCSIFRAVISMVRYKVSGFRESVVDAKSSHTSSL